MHILIAGLASGLFMAQTFITIGCIAAFFALKDPPPAVAVMLARFPPGVFVMTVVIFAYPVWGIVGVFLALLFIALQDAAPGAGLGSPNIAYTIGVSLVTIALAIPLIVLAKRLWLGVACVTLLAVAIFGWLMPLLAS